MNRVEELVEQGAYYKVKLDSESSAEIFQWVGEVLLYIESTYANTSTLNFFTADVENFRNQWLTLDILGSETFNSMFSQLKAIEKHEKAILNTKEDQKAKNLSAFENMK